MDTRDFGWGFTSYYQGNYEETILPNGTTQRLHYLPGGSLMVETVSPGSTTGTKVLYYGYQDHLGSLTALVRERVNGNGNGGISRIVADYRSYDAWGRLRENDDWTLPRTTDLQITDRGYTGHEHLQSFGIINMNGRVYDPLTAQFFSPDPYVQALDSWLNYNRYAYCLNNPLIYTDPDGEWIQFVVAALIGGAYNLYSNWDKIENGWDFLGYFASGAVGGAIAVVNPMAGATFTASGNVAMDIATGHLPDFRNPTAVAGYVIGTALDGLAVVGAGQLGVAAEEWITSLTSKLTITATHTATGDMAGEISDVVITAQKKTTAESAVETIISTTKPHGNAVHWRTMQNIAREEAAKGNTVYLNKSLNTSLNTKIDGVGKWRPDVIGVGPNNSLSITEVRSPAQSIRYLNEKLESMSFNLSKHGYKVDIHLRDYRGWVIK